MRSWFIACLLAVGFGCAAAGQDYPAHTITLIVPYPPGGGVDAMARIVAEKFSAALGEQVIVDNRSGGSGNVGTRAAAKAAPIATDDVKQRIAAEGGDPLTSTPAEYDTDIDREATKWAGLIARLGLRVD
jgi:tripartite-type tricarboxylate transporter receptor subunit TctC